MGVLAALEDIIPDQVKSGFIIRLDGLGSLYIKLKGESAETEDECTVRNITGVSVTFRPEKSFKEQINSGVNFERVSSSAPSSVSEPQT